MVLLGGLSCLLFGFLSVVFWSKEHYSLDQSLIGIEGFVADAREEGGSRYGDLVIQLEASDIRYRSPMAYPSGFKFGEETAEHLPPGTKVVLVLEKREFESPPRKHRIKGYHWHEFVGLSSGGVTHFSPRNHERYERRNDQLGKFTLPIISLLGAWLLFHGIFKTPSAPPRGKQP